MNSFKLALRSIIVKRQYTWINILGLSSRSLTKPTI